MEQDHIFQLYIQHESGNLSPEDEQYIETQLLQNESFAQQWKKLVDEGNTLPVKSVLQHADPQQALQQHYRRRKKIVRMHRLRMVSAAAILLLIAFSGAWYLHLRNKPIADSIARLAIAVKPPVQLNLANGNTITLRQDSNHVIRIGDAVIKTKNGQLAYTSADTTLNTLTVPPGEHYRLLLSDGTEVWLNAATTLRFPFNFYGNTREVSVEGEAYFKIAADSKRPFIVRSAAQQIEVLGTSFNINTYNNGIVQTSLVSGQVRLHSHAGQVQLLNPGSQAIYENNDFSVRKFDEEDVLSWMSGITYYHSLPLRQLAPIAARFYGVEVEIENPALSARSFTGLMERNKLEDFLSDLKVTGNITSVVHGDKIILR
ncbi:FecR family protein [Chitinophaga sp. Hz27]|uniref:FecR family protein n=1 Tax=Chitinophaga sp. Hz27 TaxID=3347169 RepID=UPI0035D73F22